MGSYQYMNGDGIVMTLNTFKGVSDVRAELEKPFPQEAIKQRQGGGGRMFDYVGHDTVTRRLIEATGGVFNWTIVHQEFRVDGNLTTHIVTGVLEIPGLGARSGTGVQKIQPASGEDQYKAAESDAIKRAAMRFGVAIDLYGEDIEGQLAQAQVARVGSAAAAAKTVPDLMEERLSACEHEKARLTANRLRAQAKQMFDKDKMSALTYDELAELLEWCYAQP